MTYHIREAKPEDIDAITALLTELNRGEGYDVIAQGDKVARALFGESREVDVKALVAVSSSFPRRRESLAISTDSSVGEAHDSRLRGNDEVGGVLMYYPGYDTLSATVGYHLADIIVTKEMRGRGIGKALVKALAQMTLDEGKDWVSLTALEKNAGAQAFYEALGMTRVMVRFFAAGKLGLAGM